MLGKSRCNQGSKTGVGSRVFKKKKKKNKGGSVGEQSSELAPGPNCRYKKSKKRERIGSKGFKLKFEIKRTELGCKRKREGGRERERERESRKRRKASHR